ncbi:low affinity immunoglobulin gamma Fc region receptor II-a-like [Archocentrus centrarchus]|uniref:low affinity immunoglobulin gamma Fc region receptor II-a-like n=1 Tax=Archocentrus centrarchus TaxID=63155 RepID=UPI0011EA3A47|nr:low affinity immunoglobulin gamma Fc region receptor II-a-like [Archocentrus centrarchus]
MAVESPNLRLKEGGEASLSTSLSLVHLKQAVCVLVFGLQQDNMEVRALCVRLLMIVMILLDGQDQKADAVSLSITPNRSQFFEYESVTFYCEGVDHCEVVHKFKGKVKACSKTNKRTPTGSSCSIKNVYTDDSGEYWSETGGGKRSNIINISVTAGSVILEVPALPVMEGQTVTLHCRNKIASSNLTADFYKDGRHIQRSSTRNMNIYRVSKSDEGLYKCSISGAGESPESWLKVTEVSRSSSAVTPWIIATVLFSVLLMVAVGLYHFVKCCSNRALLCQSSKAEGSGSAEDQTGSIETSAVNAGRATHAATHACNTFYRANKQDEDGLPTRPIYYTLGPGDPQQQGTFTKMPSAAVYQIIAEDPFYSTIQ